MDNPAINIISVCSGIGGLDLGAGAAIRSMGITPRTICYVEREAFACAVLEARMEAGDLESAPIWTDIESFPGGIFAGYCDMVIGGLPCQPYSIAGKKRGIADERYIWEAFFALLQTVRPALVFLENVPGLLQFFKPLGQRLCAMGYEIEAGIFSAAEVGAPHRRERLFVLAHSDGKRRRGRRHGVARWCQGEIQTARSRGAMGEIPAYPPTPDDRDGWESVVAMRPDLAPSIDGKLNPRFVEWLMNFPAGWTEISGAARVDRLRALGNAVVPATAELAVKTLWRRGKEDE